MKTSIIMFPLIFTFANTFSVETQNLAIAKCIQKTGIPESIATNIGIALEIPDTNIAKKFLTCLNKKMGFQDEEGQILFDNMKNSLTGLTGTEINSTINTCKQVKGSSSIENSYLATKCIFRKIKSIIRLKKRK